MPPTLFFQRPRLAPNQRTYPVSRRPIGRANAYPRSGKLDRRRKASGSPTSPNSCSSSHHKRIDAKITGSFSSHPVNAGSFIQKYCFQPAFAFQCLEFGLADRSKLGYTPHAQRI